MWGRISMINLNENYKFICNGLLNKINNYKSELIELLIQVETYNMAIDEIACSVNLLENLHKQEIYIQKKYEKVMTSFLPLNQPLYSLMLQVIVPSLILKSVYYRPPVLLAELHKKIYFLICSDICINMHICNMERKKFINQYVLKSDVVNFTGKYENALNLIEKFTPNLSMIYNGSAVNPIVVSSTCNIDDAVKGVVDARLYNSGQDCMAPGVIFVEKSIVHIFLDKLNEALCSLKTKDNSDYSSSIGNLIERASIEEYLHFRSVYKENLILDANINIDKNIMSPSVFYFETPQVDVQNIYFAPYFIIMQYNTINEIESYLNTKFCELYSGYISVYASIESKEYITYTWRSGTNNLVPLINCNLLDMEDGNEEFGGYGKGCSFVYQNGKYFTHPILILRELNNMFS